MMPPSGAPKPPSAVRAAFTEALEASLDRAAARQIDPGIPALHRLNRTEYANAIRDLLALEVEVDAMLPPDDSAAGFDNIADVLGVSPALIEGYAAAAAKISRLAVGDPSIGLDRVTYRVPGDISQDDHVDGLPLGTRGGLVVRHTFPLDAEYELQVGQAGGARLGGPAAAGPRTDDLYVTVDGMRVALQGRGRNSDAGHRRPARDRCGHDRPQSRRFRRRRLPRRRAHPRHHPDDHRGAVQCDGAWRHTEPAPIADLRACGRRQMNCPVRGRS